MNSPYEGVDMREIVVEALALRKRFPYQEFFTEDDERKHLRGLAAEDWRQAFAFDALRYFQAGQLAHRREEIMQVDEGVG